MSHELLQISEGEFNIRQLGDNEALLYKSMRLEAIQTERDNVQIQYTC